MTASRLASNDASEPRSVAKPNSREAVGGPISATLASQFQRRLIQQTVQALWQPGLKDESGVRPAIKAMVEALKGIAPEDEAEGMLAAQMVAVHSGALECFRRAMIPDQPCDVRNANLKHGERLTRTYLSLLAGLDKRRGRAPQPITIRDVNVASGGQAIVGAVNVSDRSHTRHGAGSGAPGPRCDRAPDQRGENAASGPAHPQADETTGSTKAGNDAGEIPASAKKRVRSKKRA